MKCGSEKGTYLICVVHIHVSEAAIGWKLGDLGLVPTVLGLQLSNRKNNDQIYVKWGDRGSPVFQRHCSSSSHS